MPILEAHRSALEANGFSLLNPGWQIIDSADLHEGDEPAAMMTKLTNAFYAFGRTHWEWRMSSPSTAGAPGLLKGNATYCACATFNLNLKYLAETICGLTGFGPLGRRDTHFLTQPGSTCIDSGWQGNVKTDTEDYEALGCFKFSAHYWLVFQGGNYDVCFNRTPANTTSIIWAGLLPDPVEARERGLEETKLRKLDSPKRRGVKTYSHIREVSPGELPRGWPTWELV